MFAQDFPQIIIQSIALASSQVFNPVAAVSIRSMNRLSLFMYFSFSDISVC